MSSILRFTFVLALLPAAWPLPARTQPPPPAAAAPARSADDLVSAARAAARADRNREAGDLFAGAIAADPARRRELLQEYADQLNYSGRSRAAIPLFQEALQAPRSGDERLRSLKGLGLALLWTDQPGRARPVFETLLRETPADDDAGRNLGRALSWSGRQRAAVAHLAQHLRTHPGDDDARVIQAQAQAWLGRPDEAERTLSGATARHATARELAAELARGQAPRSVAELQRSSQSDQIDIRAARLGHSVSFGQGRGTIGARIDRIEYERHDGADAALVRRPMMQARYRFDDAFEWNGEFGQERIRMRTGEAHDPSVYATWLTWWPGDLWRFDLSTNRGTFDNLQSLRLGLTAREHGLSADLTPTERQRYTLRLHHADYSDGNTRRGTQFETEYRWRTHPDAWAGLRHTRYEFARQSNNGYFNPLTFESTQLTLRAAWRPDGPQGRWHVAIAGAIGREHAVPDGGKPAHDASLRVGWRLDARTRLEARAQRFSSLTAAAGFARTTFGLSLDRDW